MFDPTIYDNLKVVLEGCIYDLDLDGHILVTDRSDRVELATMSRSCSIRFRQLHGAGQAQAVIGLHATLADLAAELLRPAGSPPGCELDISFETRVFDPDTECPVIERELLAIWDHRPTVRQLLSFEMPQVEEGYVDRIILRFGRKLDENQAEDFPRLVDVAWRSLQWLNRYHSGQEGERR